MASILGLLQSPGMRQIVRFGVVGLSQNLFLYLAYLGLTSLGADPKLVVTLLYPCGVALSFAGNKTFTFRSRAPVLASSLRFVGVHLIGYGLNVVILFFWVDKLGYPHQIVQIGAIFTVAAFLFVACKYLVFSAPDNERRTP